MVSRRYDEGFEDGVKAMLTFFKYQLTGSSGSHIERSLLDRWLEKAKKRFLNEEATEKESCSRPVKR